MAVERHPVSRQAYEEIRKTILRGTYAPGAKLVVRLLAEELGLSPTPAKAALVALEIEGLVRAVPGRGYFVQTFDEAAIREISAFRGVIDRLATELAADSPGHEKLAANLELNLDLQRLALAGSDTQAYADLNNEFHQMIWEAAGNRWLAESARHLAGQLRLLTNSSIQNPHRPGQSIQEHGAIAAALAVGDGALAGARALEHALHSADILLDIARGATRS